MKLLIVRHGDPDYAIDSLTEKGWREAKLLSNRLVRENPVTWPPPSLLCYTRDSMLIAVEWSILHSLPCRQRGVHFRSERRQVCDYQKEIA